MPTIIGASFDVTFTTLAFHCHRNTKFVLVHSGFTRMKLTRLAALLRSWWAWGMRLEKAWAYTLRTQCLCMWPALLSKIGVHFTLKLATIKRESHNNARFIGHHLDSGRSAGGCRWNPACWVRRWAQISADISQQLTVRLLPSNRAFRGVLTPRSPRGRLHHQNFSIAEPQITEGKNHFTPVISLTSKLEITSKTPSWLCASESWLRIAVARLSMHFELHSRLNAWKINSFDYTKCSQSQSVQICDPITIGPAHSWLLAVFLQIKLISLIQTYF